MVLAQLRASNEGLPRPRVARAQRQDHRASSFLLTPPRGWPEVPFDCAHRTTLILPNDPSKLARFTFLGMAPVLVPLRPSSEHILIVRAPGARDQHGCHSTPLRARRALRLPFISPMPH